MRWQDPRVNIYADWAGLPATTVYCGEYELLPGEAVEFVNRARGGGVNVSLHCLPEGQHDFISGGRVPAAAPAGSTRRSLPSTSRQRRLPSR